MENYKLGLVSVSFRDKSPVEILTEMKKSDLEYIEWGSDVHAPCDDKNKLYEIAELQREYSIECSSYGTYFRLGVTPVSELENYITAAKILGTNILRLWCGDKNSEDYSADEKALLFKDCKTAAEIAKNHSVTVCMECHNGTYTNSKESALELMNEVNSPHFRMYWQPNQYKSEEENVLYARLLSRYTRHIHIFNWKKAEHLPLEEGIAMWKKYLAELGGNKTLLLEFMPDNRIESLSRETEALCRITEEM